MGFDPMALISGLTGLGNLGMGVWEFLDAVRRQRAMQRDPAFSRLINEMMVYEPMQQQGTGAWGYRDDGSAINWQDMASNTMADLLASPVVTPRMQSVMAGQTTAPIPTSTTPATTSTAPVVSPQPAPPPALANQQGSRAALGSNYGQQNTSRPPREIVYPGEPGYEDSYRPGGPIPGRVPREAGDGPGIGDWMRDTSENALRDWLSGLGGGNQASSTGTPGSGTGNRPRSLGQARPLADLLGRGLPSYQTGTPYVPRTGPANLHEGEAVVPANQNPNNPRNYPPGIRSVAPPSAPQGGLRRAFAAPASPSPGTTPAPVAPPPAPPAAPKRQVFSSPEQVAAYEAQQAQEQQQADMFRAQAEAFAAAGQTPPSEMGYTPPPVRPIPPIPDTPPPVVSTPNPSPADSIPASVQNLLRRNDLTIQELLGMQGPLTADVQQQMLSGIRDNRDQGLQEALRQQNEQMAGRGIGSGNLADYMAFQGRMARDADMANAERQIGVDAATTNFDSRLAALTGAQQGIGLGGNLISGQQRLDLDSQLGNRGMDIQELLGQGSLDLQRELGIGGLDLQRELGLGGLGLQRELGLGDLDIRRLLGEGQLALGERGLDFDIGRFNREFGLTEDRDIWERLTGNAALTMQQLLAMNDMLGGWDSTNRDWLMQQLGALFDTYSGGNNGNFEFRLEQPA